MNPFLAFTIKTTVFFFFVLLCSIGYSQEICNNALDDDNDGLIDLNDSVDCSCGVGSAFPVPSIIPNPSFEQMSYCPTTISQLDAATGWIQATNATTDYMNTCGYVYTTSPGITPFPDGNGVVGAVYTQNWKEYVGSCLLSPMVAGTGYTIVFQVAAEWRGCAGLIPAPVNVSIFGAGSCASLPVSTYDCPSSVDPAWSLLGDVSYIPSSTWGTVSITFTPTININTIMLGPPCALPASYGTTFDSCSLYVYYDDLILNKSSQFQSASLSSTGNYCAGNIVLTANITSTYSAGAVLQWYHNGIALLGATATTYSVPAGSTGIGDYEFILKDGAYCLSSNRYTVVALYPPPLAISPIPVVCHNGIINLTSPSVGTYYTWQGPDSFTAAVQNPVIMNAGSINQGVYSVSVTLDGCVNTGTVNVTVYDSLSFIDVPSNVTLCAGKTAVLATSGALGGSGSYEYSWSPVTGLSGSSSPVVTFTGQATTTYTLTLADANCPTTLPISTVVTVSVNPTPAITFTTSNFRGCAPFCTNLSSSSFPPSVGCLWSFGTNVSTTACDTLRFCFPVPGVYDVTFTVTDINGCVNSVSQPAFIIVDPKPLPDFYWSPLNPTVLENEIHYTDASTVGLPMQNWSWNFGDQFVSNEANTSAAQNPAHVYDNPGTYPVSLIVTNSFGCLDTVTKLILIENDVALYIPNAFSPGKNDGINDTFNVKGVGFFAESFFMAIYDRWGHLLFETNDIHKGWDGTKNGIKAAQDVYIYKIRIKDMKKRYRDFAGHVTLL